MCGRRRAIGLFEAIVATLFYYRHNQSQQVTAAVFGVSQPTVSRLVTAVEEPIVAVCDPQLPALVEVLAGRVILTDGTLIPTGNRASHRELYSGKRRRAGAAAQVLSDTAGQLRHVSEPMAGSVHDVTAFRASGLADVLAKHMANDMVIADLGYLGEPVVTPVRKPAGGQLSAGQKEANRHLSAIRAPVERAIAHLKNWKILATGYRRPLRKLAGCLVAVSALEFFRLYWMPF